MYLLYKFKGADIDLLCNRVYYQYKLYFYGIRAANWPLGFHTNLKLIIIITDNDIQPDPNSAASVMKHISHQK